MCRAQAVKAINYSPLSELNVTYQHWLLALTIRLPIMNRLCIIKLRPNTIFYNGHVANGSEKG